MMYPKQEVLKIVGHPITVRWWGIGPGKYYVYALRNPITGKIFYVGRTRQIRKRMRAHIKGTTLLYADDSKLYSLVRFILGHGLGFTCDIIGKFSTVELSNEYENKSMCIVEYFGMDQLKNIVRNG